MALTVSSESLRSSEMSAQLAAKNLSRFEKLILLLAQQSEFVSINHATQLVSLVKGVLTASWVVGFAPNELEPSFPHLEQ